MSDFSSQQETNRQYDYIKKLAEEVKLREIKLGRPLTACIVTFGCQMNARDSEKLMGILESAGFVESDSEFSDFVLFNTCTVRENANERLYGHLGHLKHYKESHPDTVIAVCGCMMQEPAEEKKVRDVYKFIDVAFGTHNIYKLAELLYEFYSTGHRVIDVWQQEKDIVEELPAKRKYPFKSGVNIMFGCNNFCSYCIVPYVRGRERSRKPEDIISEIKGLVADGVREIMLLGQNVNSYGRGLEHEISFAELLKQVIEINGLERVRFMTSHPKDLSDELIDVMASSQKVCRHLHLPLQSGSTKILTEMNRRYTKESYLALVDRIRAKIPDISLTTDIIVGFPGETDEDFEETLDVVRKVRYDSAFTFIYSPREGTPAASFDNQVPKEVIKVRFKKLIDLVQDIASDVCKKDLGKVLPVLVEEVDEHDDTMLTGRLSNNIMVHFAGSPDLVGTIVQTELTDAHGFYYIGRMID